MKPAMKRKLEAAGFRIGTAAEFLGLTPDETKVVELRVRLALLIRARREAAGMSQKELAAKMGSSQPRVAAMEHGVGSSLDLLFRALFACGGTVADLADAPAKPSRTRRRVAG